LDVKNTNNERDPNLKADYFIPEEELQRQNLEVIEKSKLLLNDLNKHSNKKRNKNLNEITVAAVEPVIETYNVVTSEPVINKEPSCVILHVIKEEKNIETDNIYKSMDFQEINENIIIEKRLSNKLNGNVYTGNDLLSIEASERDKLFPHSLSNENNGHITTNQNILTENSEKEIKTTKYPTFNQNVEHLKFDKTQNEINLTNNNLNQDKIYISENSVTEAQNDENLLEELNNLAKENDNNQMKNENSTLAIKVEDFVKS